MFTSQPQPKKGCLIDSSTEISKTVCLAPRCLCVLYLNFFSPICGRFYFVQNSICVRFMHILIVIFWRTFIAINYRVKRNFTSKTRRFFFGKTVYRDENKHENERRDVIIDICGCLSSSHCICYFLNFVRYGDPALVWMLGSQSSIESNGNKSQVQI